MALITRLGNLFAADMHAVLDKLEEPEQVLRQAIREMEAEIADAQRQAKHKHDEVARLVRQREETRTRVDAMDVELDLCFSAGQDDLARSLIRRKLAAEYLLSQFEVMLAQLSEELAWLQSSLSEQRQKLSEIHQKAQVFEVTSTSNRLSSCMQVPLIDADAVEVAFLREKHRRLA